jgi:hypothetical protein
MTTTGKYLLVTNLTADPVFIPPDSRGGDNPRTDITLMPYATVNLKPSEWVEDANLESMVEKGMIQLTYSDVRAKPIPMRPTEAQMGNPYYNAMINEIVFGTDDHARDFISSEKRFLDRAGQPLDMEWTKGTLWHCLEGARKWLELWGPPADLAWRVQAINDRLEEIRRMP